MLVLWYSGDTIISKLVKLVTGSPYSHVAIAVNGVVYEAVARGIVAREGEDATARINEACAMAYLPVDERDDEQVEWWLRHRVGRRYSVSGFLAAGIAQLTGFRVVLALENSYICSGLVATALQIAGYLPKVDARLETPASLAAVFNPGPVVKPCDCWRGLGECSCDR